MAFLVGETRIGGDRGEQAGDEWRVDTFEELQEEHADAIALREQAVASGVAHFLDEALCAEL